jgi:hypothetical protein
MGALGRYGGGIVRGAETRRMDAFAGEGLQLWHYDAVPVGVGDVAHARLNCLVRRFSSLPGRG